MVDKVLGSFAQQVLTDEPTLQPTTSASPSAAAAAAASAGVHPAGFAMSHLMELYRQQAAAVAAAAANSPPPPPQPTPQPLAAFEAQQRQLLELQQR